jgi:seryl-tRNA synthetase
LDFSELKVYTDQYYQGLNDLQKIDEIETVDIGEKKNKEETRKKLLENIKSIKARVTELQNEFLRGDRSRQILLDLQDELDENSVIISPEDVAKQIENKQPPLVSLIPMNNV